MSRTENTPRKGAFCHFVDKRSCERKGVSWAEGRKRSKDIGKIRVQKGNGVGRHAPDKDRGQRVTIRVMEEGNC